MKLFRNNKLLGKLRSTSSVGMVLSGVGLTVLGLGLVHCLRGWQGAPISTSTLLVEFFCAFALASVGFTLMVIGADPFAESTDTDLSNDPDEQSTSN